MRWASIEDTLLRIFIGLLKSSDVRAASAAFYSMPHFNQKMKMTEVVAGVILQGEALERWEKLKNRIWSASVTRNQLAHYGAMWISDSSSIWQILMPSPYDQKSLDVGSAEKIKRYTDDDLANAWRKITKLLADLTSFADYCGFSAPDPEGLGDAVDSAQAG